MKAASVCSGIGAPEMSAPWIDWRWCAEIEAFPSAVMAHRHPDIPNRGDMTKFREWPLDPIDLLVGGTPCQSFSIAGLRKGLADPRGNLALTFLAILDRFNPGWFVWENVPGVLSAVSHETPDPRPPDVDLDGDDAPRDGQEVVVTDEYTSVEEHALWCFMAGAAELGYHGGFISFDAQWTQTPQFPSAVPQRRERLFFVGYLGDWRRAAAVLFDGQSLSGHPPPRREQGQRIAGTLDARTQGGGGLGTDFELGGGLVPDVANPLTARMHKGINTTMDEGQTMVAHAWRANGFDASEDGTGRGTPIIAFHGSQDPDVSGDIAHPVGRNHGQETCVAFGSKDHGADASAEVAPTLRSGGHDASHANAGVPPAIAIQERATAQNPAHGPDGAGARDDGAAYTLEARTGVQAVAFAQNQRGELRTSDISPQLMTGGGKPGEGYPAVCFDLRGREGGAMPEGPHHTANLRAANGGSSRSYVADAFAVRRLTPLECERLMGFPDHYTAIPYRRRRITADEAAYFYEHGLPFVMTKDGEFFTEIAADGPRYKALGNSWALNCGHWIFDRIKLVDEMAKAA